MSLYVGGSEPAFEEIFSRYKGKVYGFLKKRVSETTVADDLFQTVFLKLHRSRESYDPARPLAAWMYVICRNVLLDHFRKQGRELVEPDERLIQLAVADGAAVEAGAEAFKNTLSEVPARQKEALEMRYLEGREFEEIAQQMGTTPANARQMVSRAIKKIRERMSR